MSNTADLLFISLFIGYAKAVSVLTLIVAYFFNQFLYSLTLRSDTTGGTRKDVRTIIWTFMWVVEYSLTFFVYQRLTVYVIVTKSSATSVGAGADKVSNQFVF